MRRSSAFPALLALAALCLASPAPGQEGFRPLFNGEDLSGWVNVNCAPSTFQVKNGMIFCTGKPIGVIRTERQYENFILELEWKHVKKGGNSGLFVWSDALPKVGRPFTRSIEVQIMDGVEKRNAKGQLLYTSQGDVFAIQGATMIPDRPHPAGWERCLPSENRTKPAGQWNHYRVECRDGVIKLAVNGKVVSGGHHCKPRKGYICLESEGSPVWFKNIRIKELPSTNPKPDEVATAAEGFRPLYNGIDLDGWQVEKGHIGHWQPRDWILHYDGKATAKKKDLWTRESFGDFILIVDWRLPGKPKKVLRPVILPSGEYALDENGKQKMVPVLDAGDSGIYLRGSSKSQVNIWCWPIGSGEVYGYRTDKSMPPEVRRAVTPKVKADRPLGQWNRFVITMKGEYLTVDLNDKRVIDRARLPGVRPRGPIALQHHGDPVQFANIYIKELDRER